MKVEDRHVDDAVVMDDVVLRAADIIRGSKQLAIDQTTEMRRRFQADPGNQWLRSVFVKLHGPVGAKPEPP